MLQAIFLLNLWDFLRKMVHVVNDRYFPLFSKGFEDFSYSPMLSLKVPLKQ